MEKIFSDKNMDVMSFKKSNKDIMSIILIEDAKLKIKDSDAIYYNNDFVKITTRKGDTRVLDLTNGVDITKVFNNFELLYDADTKETTLFEGR